jgi:putative ABC transport system permease protein
VFDRPEQFSFINVKGDPGVSKAELRSQVDDALGGRYEALTGAQLAEEDASDVQEGIRFFSIFLLVFAGISLFVGTFMIANTFSIIVAQRTRELALLRALGAARRQVMASVLGEAFITAVVASLAGVAFGIGTSYGIRALLDAIGFGLPPGSLVLSPRTFVVSLLVGIVVTVVSAAAPARRATRVAPIEALREGGVPTGTTGSRRRLLLGSTTTVMGGVALALGLIGGGDSAVRYVGLGVFLVFMGVAFLSPALARPAARAVGAPLVGLFRLPAKLARENAMRNPRRTASTAAALMIGLALVTFVSVLSASVKTSTTKTIDKEFGADYTVTAGDFGAGFSPVVASDLAGRPELATVAAVRPGQFKLDGATKQLAGVETDKLAALLNLDIVAGGTPRGSESGLLVSEKQARDHRWKVGSAVELEFAKTGVQRIAVAGIYAKNDLAGAYLLTLSDFARNYTAINDSLVVIKAAPGVSPARSRAAVERVLDRYPNLDVRDATELKAQAASQVDRLLGVVTALLAMAILIALLGIVNTLALSIFERTRELGLLRAVGMGRRQVRSMIRCEAVIISVFGALLGLVVGIFFGWALVTALHSRGVSTLTVPGGQLVVFVVLAALAGVLAAVLPARRAARLDVLTAISHD